MGIEAYPELMDIGLSRLAAGAAAGKRRAVFEEILACDAADPESIAARLRHLEDTADAPG
jgi:hypothetical protein